MADTTVTGRIGDQEVALTNAASEATLQKLLESFEKMRTGGGSSGGAGASSGAGAGGQQAQAKATSATTTAMNSVGQAVGKFGKAIGEATGKLITFAGQLIGGTLRSATGIAKELFSGGERVSDFTKHLAELPSVFGMVGSAIHMFSSFIDKNIDIQRQLSQVGGSFGGSITEMRKAAATSGLGLDRFSKLVLENSTTMSLFGSTVSQGAVRFGQMSKQLREGQVGKQLMSMGFTIDEINDTLVAYANINSRMGHDRARSDAELIERAGKFGQELNRAAIASGLSRSQLTKTVDTMSKDIKIQSLLKDLPAELKDKVLLSLSKLTTEFDGAADALLDLADGLPQGDEAKALANFAPGMGKIMEDLKNGVIDENTARNRMIEEAKISAENIKDMGQDVITQMDQSMPGFSKMRDAILKMASSTQKSAAQIDAENKKAAAADEKANAVEKFYKSFSDVIVRFRALIEDKILNSEIFQDLEKYLQNFVGSNEGSFSNILDQIATAFSDFLFSLHLFIQDVTKVGFGQAIKTRFEAFIKDLFNIKDSDMKGKDGAPDKTIMEVIIGKAMSSIGSAIMDGIKSFFKDNSLIAIVGAGIVGLFVAAKIADSIKSLFGMGGGKAAGPAGAAGGAVSGGGALASLGGDLAKAAGWLAKGAAIGASMFAIGLGVEKLAEGLSGFQDLDWETIGKGVTAIGAFGLAAGIMGEFIVPIGLGAAAIGALGLAVSMFPADRLKILGDILQTAFNGISQIIDAVGTAVTKPLTAIGTLMEKITAMRTAVIEATTQQIQTLSQIPSDKMLSAAAGIDAIKKALDGFSPGFLSGLSSGLGSIFAADEASVLNKMANLGPKLGEAANGYTAFKTAIAGMNLANLTMTSEQTDSFVTLTNNLPKFTATMTNLGAQASNISAAATAIGAFRTATEGFDLKDFTFSKEQLTSLADGTTKLRALSEQLTSAKDGFQKLDNQGLTKIKDGVENLSKAFKDFNESFIDKFIPKLDALKSKTQEGLMTDIGAKLDTLNSNVTSLISIESDSKRYLDTIASKRPGVVSGGKG
jgi:hypothetical protein